jgi:putative peptidoglycan lipid II flippase
MKPVIPKLSKFHQLHQYDSFKILYNKTIFYILSLGIPVFIAIWIIGKPFLAFIIKYGDVTPKNIDLLWYFMILLYGVFIGGILGRISSTSFYCLGNTKIPTKIGVYSYTIYIPLKIMAFYYFSVMGVAVTTSVFVLFNFLMQNYLLKKLYLKQEAFNENK